MNLRLWSRWSVSHSHELQKVGIISLSPFCHNSWSMCKAVLSAQVTQPIGFHHLMEEYICKQWEWMCWIVSIIATKATISIRSCNHPFGCNTHNHSIFFLNKLKKISHPRVPTKHTHIHNNVLWDWKYSTKYCPHSVWIWGIYCQSHQTMLWIWIMLYKYSQRVQFPYLVLMVDENCMSFHDPTDRQ